MNEIKYRSKSNQEFLEDIGDDIIKSMESWTRFGNIRANGVRSEKKQKTWKIAKYRK